MPPLNLPSLGRPPKLLVPFLVGAAGLGAFALVVTGQQQVKQLQQQLMAAHQQLTQLQQENQELSGRLQGLEGERKDLDRRLSGLREQLTSASAELDRSKTALKDAEERYTKLTDERSQLQTQVATLTSQRDDASKKVQQMEEENAQLQKTASRLRERFALLDRDYRTLSDKMSQVVEAAQRVTVGGAVLPQDPMAPPGIAADTDTSLDRGIVELPPIVVRKDQAGTSLPIRGRVIQADETHNFVVIDQGSDDGVRAGMMLSIVRSGATVGRVNVIRVRSHLSACDIIRSSTPGPLQMGDMVVESGS